jgi:alkylation response protein AidB-like acyl-CoA dehydrogenase
VDLNYTPGDDAFRARVREWLEQNLPDEPVETVAQQRAWHRKLYDAGLVGMGWPREYGGQDARPMEQAIAAEEMARVNAPLGVKTLGIAIVGPTIIHHGTEEQKQRFLKPMLMGEEIWCQLYSEPNSGSDLASLACRADIDGDEFVINGQKIWSSGAQDANWGLMLARTDRSAPKHQGISCILVPMDQPGIEVRPLKQISGSSEFCEVFFTDVRVAADNLVGELNTGWQIAQTTLGYERGGDTLARVQHLKSQYRRLLEVARVIQRDGKPTIDDPIIRQKLAAIAADIEVLRYTSLRILSRLEKGERPGPESSIAKLHYSELDKRVQETIVDILGPYGQQTDNIPAEIALSPDGAAAREGEGGNWAYRFVFSRAGTIYSGSNQIQKNIIGERVLGLPKEVRADRLAAIEAANAKSGGR